MYLMKNKDYQSLQSALGLPTHEEAFEIFQAVEDLNVRSTAGKVNILHHFISTYGYSSGKHLRIKDFYTLIQMGADVNAQAHDGQTPLHYCCNDCNYEAAKILIENGAEVDKADNTGRTPLFAAVMKYRGQKDLLKIILLFLEKGADLDKTNHSGKTPRDAAKIIKFMVDNSPTGKKEWDLSDYINLT